MLKNLSMRVIALNFNAYKFERQAFTVQKLVLARGLQCRYESAPKWSRPVCGTGLGHLTPFFYLIASIHRKPKKIGFQLQAVNFTASKIGTEKGLKTNTYVVIKFSREGG